MVSMTLQLWRKPKLVLPWALVPLLLNLPPTWSWPMITLHPLLPPLRKDALSTTTWNKYVYWLIKESWVSLDEKYKNYILYFSSSVILSLPTLEKSFASSSLPLLVSLRLSSLFSSSGLTLSLTVKILFIYFKSELNNIWFIRLKLI